MKHLLNVGVFCFALSSAGLFGVLASLAMAGVIAEDLRRERDYEER